MRLLLALVALLPSAFAEDKAPVFPQACQESCVTKFGTRLGATRDGVESFSNCQPKCVYENPSYVGKAYAGIEWQCVEFARRWLLRNKGLTFDSIDVAADLWNKIDHLADEKKAAVPLTKTENGASSLPKPGALLVYAREYLDTGHVAVVLRVDRVKRLVYVGEENFTNAKWPADYARAIPFVKRGSSYWILDRYLLGWKSY
jgi:hypothetical protein